MKKLFALFIVLMISVQAQVEYKIDLSTIANSVDETVYFDYLKVANENGIYLIDSIGVSMYLNGEADVDSITVYPGFVHSIGTNVLARTYSATVLVNYTVTLNIAAAGTGYEAVFSSDASLTTANLHGYNTLKILTRGATSGNDATDPNRGFIVFHIYGQKDKAVLLHVADCDTISNALVDSVFCDFRDIAKSKGFREIDSIKIALFVKNETDIDSVAAYKAYVTTVGNKRLARIVNATNVGDFVATLNIADGSNGYERLTDGTAPISAAVLRGYNSLAVSVVGAASGNDATDPNRGYVVFYIYCKR